MVLTNNSINYISGNSLSILNTETLLIEKFNKQKTNGEIGINGAFNFLKVDTHGNISKIVELAKVNGYTQDGFPKVILALRKYKMNTLELISSEEFTTFSPYPNDFDPNNNLLIAGSQIYQIRNGETFLLNKILFNSKILFSKTNIVWLSIFNQALLKTELIEYDLISNSYKILAAPTDKPNYSISNFKLDSKGNFWAVVSNKGLGKFDGNVWIFYNMDNSPIDVNINDFDINKFDEIYVLSNSIKNFSSITGSVHLFSNNTWTLLLRNFPFNCAMKVDNQGNLWFNPNNSSLLKVDKCLLIPIPKIRTNTNTIVVSQNVRFTAEGCDNVFWQWNSSSESGEKTILGSNNFELFVKANTTIIAKCLSNNCTSSQASIEIKLVPKIWVSNALPNKVCIDEEIKIFPSIQGNFEPNNQFVAQLKKDNIISLFLIEKREDGYFIKVGSRYLNGLYALTMSSTSPSIKSEDIVEVFLTNSPKTKISGNKTICGVGEIIIAAITDFGTPPFKYSWYKDSNPLENMNALSIKVNSKGVYKIQVLDAMNCSSVAAEISINQYNFPQVSNLKQSNGFILLNKPDTLSFTTQNGYKIEWQKDGNIIYGETTNKLIVKEAGKYTAMVDNNGCKMGVTFSPVSVVLGDEVISSTINFNISPNPFNEQITIDLISMEKFSGNLILVDIKGKIINQYSIKDEFSLTKQIKTNQLSSGTYFIKFVEKRFTKSYKIIKY